MKRGATAFWVGASAAIALAVVAAFGIQNEYVFFAGYVVLQFVVLATAWNILGGYAGYVNFGTGAFFGVGAYTSVVLIQALNAPLLVQIAAAAVLSGLLGFGTGLLTLRLRGIFFSIATVAVAIIFETLIINWRYVGGATGVQLLRPACGGWVLAARGWALQMLLLADGVGFAKPGAEVGVEIVERVAAACVRLILVREDAAAFGAAPQRSLHARPTLRIASSTSMSAASWSLPVRFDSMRCSMDAAGIRTFSISNTVASACARA